MNVCYRIRYWWNYNYWEICKKSALLKFDYMVLAFYSVQNYPYYRIHLFPIILLFKGGLIQYMILKCTIIIIIIINITHSHTHSQSHSFVHSQSHSLASLSLTHHSQTHSSHLIHASLINALNSPTTSSSSFSSLTHHP